MPIVNEGIISELEYVEKPFELNHIKGLFENTDPLMQETAYALITGDQHAVDRLTRQALDDGFDANTVLDDGLIAGMAIVGVKFRDNIIFVPEVLVAARAMKAGMAHLEPILSASGIEPVGTVIMGTVKGDLHDIGKEPVHHDAEGSRVRPCTTWAWTPSRTSSSTPWSSTTPRSWACPRFSRPTMPNMGKTIDAFEEAGLREMVKIMVGGAPVTQEFADDMGADGYGKDAIACVEKAKELVGLTSEPEPVAVG